MNTIVYFIRHAEPDYSVHDDMLRPLTEKGIKDAMKLPKFFATIKIDKVISSPFKRAQASVNPIALDRGLEVELIDDFRERKVSDGHWIEDFNAFAKSQWKDFDYCLPGGDCLNEVQERNVNALRNVINLNLGSNIIIGSHGTALSTIINYYDKSFGYDEFDKIKKVMPWIVKFTFEGDNGPLVEYFNL